MSGIGLPRSLRTSLAPLVVALFLFLLWPAGAFARALVRVFHAVPGVGAARVQFTFGSQTVDLGTIAFAQSTQWHSVRSGSFVWKLLGSGGKVLATGNSTVGNGAYDIVVLARSQGVSLGIYKASAGRPGTSLVRVIHAAPELGSPELKVDSKIVDTSLAFTQATPYLSLSPGVHSFAAMRAGVSTPFLQVSGVHLASGASYSAIVMGSRGQRTRVVLVTDRGAPLTVPAPQQQPASGPGWITVHSGDSLWAIARSRLSAGASNEAVYREVIAIWDANASRIGTGDPNLIFPGTRLHLP
jgi:hypothetical protein